MPNNDVVETMLNRKSIRRYTDESPSDEVISTIVRVGQQAPFAYQLCSLLLSRHGTATGTPLAHLCSLPSASIPIVLS